MKMETRLKTTWRVAVMSMTLFTVVVMTSCQSYLPDLAHTPSSSNRGRLCVEEGYITVRDGEEAQVAYKPVYHAPPRLVIVEISQSWFKQAPFKKDDFELRQQE